MTKKTDGLFSIETLNKSTQSSVLLYMQGYLVTNISSSSCGLQNDLYVVKNVFKNDGSKQYR